ncbi:MAG: GspE/PulE family protein [Verrucomicrobia bacterium]|nr:GspE/PulE family protein [Verrucomicrobiota bacterium]
MSELFVKAAEIAGASDTEKVEHIVVEAAKGQRSVIDDILDSQLVNEEIFLEQLSREMGMEWEPELSPKNGRRLKQVCPGKVAIKHCMLPLWAGTEAPLDDDEGLDGVPADEAHVSGVREDAAVSAEDPVDKGPERLCIATYDPFNLIARQAAGQGIGLPIQWKMASRTRIINSIQKLYGVGANTFDAILAGRGNAEEWSDEKEDKTDLDEDDEEASVVNFVNQLIRQALDQRATDIHVEPLENTLRVRYRIDGLLQDVPLPENIKALQSMVIARLKIMSRLDIAERRLPQDGRIALEMDGSPIDVRVATIPTVEGESVSLRLLNQQKFTLDKLGMIPKIRNTIDALLKMSNGIILITGPTGSGKSTSLYTFLTVLNTTETRIVTIEDPVENKLEGVMQIAVKPEIDLTFGRGLRSILRGDPNIVMIGEMRDLETAEIAVRASLTGHLVFSTLHTNDSIGGISRLIDMGVEPFLVSASVRAFLAQRLVRRLCKNCRIETVIPPEKRIPIGFPLDLPGQAYAAKPVGCDRCHHSGFNGRLAIYEICVLSKDIQDLIVKRATVADILKQAIAEGFINMRHYGFWKVMEGETTLEEVISATTTEFTMED